MRACARRNGNVANDAASRLLATLKRQGRQENEKKVLMAYNENQGVELWLRWRRAKKKRWLNAIYESGRAEQGIRQGSRGTRRMKGKEKEEAIPQQFKSEERGREEEGGGFRRDGKRSKSGRMREMGGMRRLRRGGRREKKGLEGEDETSLGKRIGDGSLGLGWGGGEAGELVATSKYLLTDTGADRGLGLAWPGRSGWASKKEWANEKNEQVGGATTWVPVRLGEMACQTRYQVSSYAPRPSAFRLCKVLISTNLSNQPRLGYLRQAGSWPAGCPKTTTRALTGTYPSIRRINKY
ncbi:hypothetical protein IF1G_00425 [Cordyceps javanica]|uniref:Uncharacterized protein n=1 Tax=Cordyceps javanica TaxID=43265 RepID=A0A545VFI3_9HYPO|nr:hypothetical protein IF1G_00425 [Cordyceps javanica]